MLATHPAHFSAFLWKSFNRNDRDQVLWARATEHPTQTLVFTKIAGRHKLLPFYTWWPRDGRKSIEGIRKVDVVDAAQLQIAQHCWEYFSSYCGGNSFSCRVSTFWFCNYNPFALLFSFRGAPLRKTSSNVHFQCLLFIAKIRHDFDRSNNISLLNSKIACKLKAL